MQRNEPWLVESAIKLIDNFLNDVSHKAVFEFGAGASTSWFHARSAFFWSVDDDKSYIPESLELIVRLAKRPYNKVIDNFIDNYFDLILVDGRDRVKCIESSIPKLKSGGWLVLDNSEREYYQRGIDLMKDWNRIDCKQNRPDKYDFIYPNWTTSIFIKP